MDKGKYKRLQLGFTVLFAAVIFLAAYLLWLF